MIIGISGRKQNGKDEVAKNLINNHGFEKYAFADPLKRAFKEIFDFSDEQLWGGKKEEIDERWGISPREALQIGGTELFQYELGLRLPNFRSKIGRKIWVKRFQIWYEKNQDKHIVFTDIRFPHEIDVLAEMKDAVWVVIDRPGYGHGDEHASEIEWTERINDADYKIINDGTKEDLNKKIDEIIRNLPK